MIGVRINHHATQQLLDEILLNIDQTFFHTFKGIEKAIFRDSGLVVEKKYRCAVNHMALVSLENGTLEKCTGDPSGGVECQNGISVYEYIPIEQRLRANFKDPNMGPDMLHYFQSMLTNETLVEPNRYIDFFSGRLFKDIVEDLGGYQNIKNDVFLTLSSDGADAFKSTNYAFWPVILTILNLKPSIRFRLTNLLPVLIIPGPHNPKNLLSFLRPLLDELEIMSNGIEVELWNHSVVKVRVHLLFVTADMIGRAKLSSTKGPNGISPCLSCHAHGLFIHHRRHVYFPHQISKDSIYIPSDNTQISNEGTRIVLWDHRNPPLRTNISVLTALIEARTLQLLGKKGQSEEILKKNGLSSTKLSPLISRSRHIKPFQSFPTDIMHLLFLNITSNLVSLWMSTDDDLSDISFLRSKNVLDNINYSTDKGYFGSAPEDRKIRTLHEFNSFKATEWKRFVLNYSVPILIEWLPDDYMEGWFKFSQLCRLLCLWELSNQDLTKIKQLSLEFYDHFSRYYYKLRDDRIHFMRFIYHEVIHLADGIKNCGPLSLLAQWPMENFIGYVKNRCNAKYKFGESIMNNLKFETATKLFCQSFSIPFQKVSLFPEDQVEKKSSTPSSIPSSPHLEGFKFLHPVRKFTVSELSKLTGLNIRKLLVDYFERSLNISRKSLFHIFSNTKQVSLWDRLADEENLTMKTVTYRSTFSSTSSKRQQDLFVAFFSDDSNTIDVYYGKALCFLEVILDTRVHFLVLASWVESLIRGKFQTVYVKKPFSHNRLFCQSRIDSIKCISHPLTAIETIKPSRSRSGTETCTYFVDDLQHEYQTSGQVEEGGKRLCGFQDD